MQNAFTDTAFFDFDSFKKCVQASVNALNEVLEEGLPLHPLDEQRESVEKWRQIGLGKMCIRDRIWYCVGTAEICGGCVYALSVPGCGIRDLCALHLSLIHIS